MREAYSRLGASVGEAPRGAVGASDSSGARENCEDAGLDVRMRGLPNCENAGLACENLRTVRTRGLPVRTRGLPNVAAVWTATNEEKMEEENMASHDASRLGSCALPIANPPDAEITASILGPRPPRRASSCLKRLSHCKVGWSMCSCPRRTVRCSGCRV